MKILLLAPYPLMEAPSQRFRFEHFLKFIEQKGISYDFQSFLSINAWRGLYQHGNALGKITGVLAGFARRFKVLFILYKYQYVYLHREASPLGPPIFEWIITQVLRKKLIYDFDDAIWLPDQKQEGLVWKTIKWRSKVGKICKWSWKVTGGNNYLANYASNFCKQVEVMPTVIDSEVHRPDNQQPTANNQQPTIGWTGSHSTLFYLDELVPILQELEKEYDFSFIVIANKNPKLPLKNFQFIEWNSDTEIEDLAKIDIGVMPLEDNEWSKGKCGFKLIQYLSLGIPAIASPVGVNSEIVINDQTGYLASTPEEWKAGLSKLLQSKELRNNLGSAGRELIVKNYSVKSQKDQFIQLFN